MSLNRLNCNLDGGFPRLVDFPDQTFSEVILWQRIGDSKNTLDRLHLSAVGRPLGFRVNPNWLDIN